MSKAMTQDEAIEWLNDMGFDLSETDNTGQVVIYTNLFLWNDGSYRTEPDPSFNDG